MDGETRIQISKLRRTSKSERNKWPDPEASTGDQYENVKLGRNGCWEARGEARKKFEEIGPKIKTHLEKCCDRLQYPVFWTMYMIGRTPKELTPTLMFIGRDKNACNEVREMIKKSGIMDKYPGIRTGILTEEIRHYAKPKPKRRRRNPRVQTCPASPVEVTTVPHTPSDTRAGIPISPNQLYITTLRPDQECLDATDGIEDRQHTNIWIDTMTEKSILYSPSDTGPGMRLHIQGTGGDSSSLRPATGGGFICHRESIFLMTVAHAFYEDSWTELPNSAENCGIEFELDDDGEEDEEEDIQSLSRYSVSFAPSESVQSDDRTISARTFSDTTSEFEQSSMIGSVTDHLINNPAPDILQVQTPVLRTHRVEPRHLVKSDTLLLPVGDIIHSRNGTRPGLDYCLIEIEANILLKSKPIIRNLDQTLYTVPSGVVMPQPRDVDVVAATGSGGFLKGRLSGTPSYLVLPGSNVVQEVWTMVHSTEVLNGDCGAWIFNASNGDLSGHVVGGSPNLKIVYIVPAHLILDDLKELYGGEWKPASIITEPAVPDQTPLLVAPQVSVPVILDAAPAPEVPDPVRVPVGHNPVLVPVIPDPAPVHFSTTEESELRRSWYIKSMQSERVKLLVGSSIFEIPLDLLVSCSTTFKKLEFLTTSKDPPTDCSPLDVTESTFEAFLVWLYSYKQRLETENIDSAFHLAIFAQKYQIYDLRNQAADILRAALHDRRWTITPAILLATYKVAPQGSSLIELCFWGFAGMEGRHRSLDWKATFLECPSLGWDYFQYKRRGETYPDGIEAGGACRFHDHSNIDGWEPQDVIQCLYSLQTSLSSASGRGNESLATVGHRSDEVPLLLSLKTNLPENTSATALAHHTKAIRLPLRFRPR